MEHNIFQRKGRGRNAFVSVGNPGEFPPHDGNDRRIWPHARPALYQVARRGLFEIRAKGKEGVGRFFFCCLVGQEVVILHSFIKKAQKIPQKEMKIARNRLKEVKK